ncbi:MAG TPA: hypothetical protein DDW98_07130 [Gammaproteobacteria bacterium]|nr:hypothetical protein [Gammaproteobacteria bacterium]
MGLRETLEARLAGGQDDAMLRLSLAQLHLRGSDWAAARDHAVACLGHDPGQAAASKVLGKALEALGDTPGAAAAYRAGIGRARAGGQIQTAREMEVFLRRLESRSSGS